MAEPAPTLDLAAIEARCAAATPDPWEANGLALVHLEVYDEASEWEEWLAHGHLVTLADAEFCAHARDDVPVLVARVRALTEALAEIAQFPIETPIMPRANMPPPLPTPQQVARSILRGERR